MREFRRVTIKDVASLAGVSVTTVSFVMNGNLSEISEETALKVKKAAEELEYVPNIRARNFAKQKSEFIAFVIPDLNNPFYTTFAQTIIDELDGTEYTLAILSTNNENDNHQQIWNVLSNATFDGAIIVSKMFDSANFREISQNFMPFIMLDEYVNEDDIPVVSNNNYLGGQLAADYLLEMNHRQIACITGPVNSPNSQLRLKGFRDKLADYSVKICGDNIKFGDYSFESGYESARTLLASENGITAMFCLNDVMAMGAVRAIREKGLSVPQDISVVGYDNVNNISELSLSLTTIDQNITEMGKVAVKLLLDTINRKSSQRKKLIIQPTLVKGGSVRQL